MKDLIKNGSKIFTHCYSTTVINILKAAKKNGTHFEVFCTETRPKFLGRRTAKALATAKIPVTIMPDLAGPTALKNCDLFLFGIESITTNNKQIVKIGTSTLLETAAKHRIPYFACTRTAKPTKKRLQKSAHVWKNPPKGIKIFNPGHEEIALPKSKILSI